MINLPSSVQLYFCKAITLDIYSREFIFAICHIFFLHYKLLARTYFSCLYALPTLDEYKVLRINIVTMAAFREMHVSPAKHSYVWLQDRQTEGQTAGFHLLSSIKVMLHHLTLYHHCMTYKENVNNSYDLNTWQIFAKIWSQCVYSIAVIL